MSPSQRQDKPNAIAWIVKNYPELKDSQICKIIGTTKPTIEAIRNGTHRDMAVIRPKNPVTIGLCSEQDIEKAVLAAKAKAEKPTAKPKKKTTAKKAAKK
ncbi:MAG: cell cycle transcriptional regulator TrcR [Alphaproteobacteria bacterium]